MEVIELTGLTAVIRDLGVVAVIIVVSLYILAKSPFSAELKGTYKLHIGHNGKFVADPGQDDEELPF